MCVFKYHAFIFPVRPPRWRCKTISTVWDLGYAGFAKNIVLLQSETKRNEIRFAAFRTLTRKFFFSASFRFKFFASDQSKINRAYFELFSLCFASNNFLFRFFFVLFLLHLIFVSLQMQKQAKKHFFAFKQKNFASVLLHFASKQNWWQFFASVSLHFTLKRNWWQFFTSVLLHFASKRKWWQFFASVLLNFSLKRKWWQFFASVLLNFSLKRKWWQFFASFSFCFRFVSFSFRFRFLCFASMRNKRKKQFFRIEATKISLPFRFISLRSENDGAP